MELVRARVRTYRAFVAVLAVLGALVIAPAAAANTFVVSSTADSGDGTLRQAIIDANGTPGGDTITFALADPLLPVIQPLVALPQITSVVQIDGGTGGPVDIDGSSADGAMYGLDFGSGSFGSDVQNVALTRWLTPNGAGLDVAGGAMVTVTRSYVGTDGTLAGNLGNYDGIEVGGTATIGAPGVGNVIGGNSTNGIYIHGQALVQGNFIGVTPGGAALPNARALLIQAGFNSGIAIGGVEAGQGNHIGDSGLGIVDILPSSGVTIRGNSMDGDSGLGIAFNVNGTSTPNDSLDADKANGGPQNYPVLTSVSGNPNTATVTGTLDSQPTHHYNLDFYASPTCNASGQGEGASFVGTTTVDTDAQGHADFSVPLTGVSGVVTATATGDDGSTSEFSACKSFTSGQCATCGGGGGATGSLAGSVAYDASGSPYDLTALGTEDWAIWGYANGGTSTSLAPDERKRGGSAISDLENIDPPPAIPLRGLGYHVEPFTFSWSDGLGGSANRRPRRHPAQRRRPDERHHAR